MFIRSEYFRRVRVSLLILSSIFSLHIQAQQYSKQDVLFDLSYLKNTLEETHFNLYGHTTKAAFEQNFASIKREIKKDSFSLLEVSNLFQKVTAGANNAHTTVTFPVSSYYEFTQSQGLVFPLEVAIEENKVFIRKNWSNQEVIKVGSELKSINGLPIKNILTQIYPLIAAESIYFKNTLIEGFSLPRYYWQAFGEQRSFIVEIIQDQKIQSFQLQGIKAWDEYEMKREDIVKAEWALEKFTDAAYLRPGNLSGDLPKFKRFIDSAFSVIRTQKTRNLIIDLRNNQGGDDPFSDYLVSYIADKPFRWNSSFELKSSRVLKEYYREKQDTTTAYAKAILEHQDGEIFTYDFGVHQPQPKEKRFTGKVYVLVNRHSFSQSTVAAAQIQDYGFGTIVGEETAEHPNLLASIFHFRLPRTDIEVGISKGKIYRVNGKDDGRGVIPDIVIRDHLLDENDEILDGLLARIKKQPY